MKNQKRGKVVFQIKLQCPFILRMIQKVTQMLYFSILARYSTNECLALDNITHKVCVFLGKANVDAIIPMTNQI